MQEKYYKDNNQKHQNPRNSDFEKLLDEDIHRVFKPVNTIQKSKKDISQYTDSNISLVIIFCILFIAVMFFAVSANTDDIIGEYSKKAAMMAASATIIELIIFCFLGFLYYKLFLSKEYSFNSIKSLSSLFPLFLVYVVMFWLLNNGMIAYLNKKLDTSEPVTYYVKIVNKRVTKGKHESFYMTITPWPPHQYYIVFQTDISTYYDFSKGDVFKAQVRKGYLGLEYFVTRYRLRKVDLNIFPKNRDYALTEEEANKIIEEKGLN